MFKLAGPICTDLIACLPLIIVVLISKYWLLIIGIGLIIIGVVTVVMRRDKQPRINKKSAILLLLGGLAVMGHFIMQYGYEHRFAGESKKLAATLDFDVYEPQIYPGGAKLVNIGLGNPKDPTNPYLFISYKDDEGRETSVYEFSVAKTKGTAGNCGPTSPELGSFSNKCLKIGTALMGNSIYVDSLDKTLRNAYITINNTRITLSYAYFEDSEVIKIFDSLQKKQATQLNFVNKL